MILEARSRDFPSQTLLETGNLSINEELAETEQINPSHVSRVLCMPLLAPEIVEAILAGRQTEGLTMARAMRPLVLEWQRQTFQ